jgi:hypothetical protein
MQKLQAEIRYLQIRLRACGPESGPFRGFQGSAAPSDTADAGWAFGSLAALEFSVQSFRSFSCLG